MATGRLEASEVGARVRSERKRLGFTRRRATRNAGFSRRQLASFERGRRPMTVDQVRSVAGSLGVDVDEFLPDVDEPAPADVRIEDIFDELPVPVTDPLPELVAPATPLDERRKAPRARAKLDQAFACAWGQIAEVTRCCEQVSAAGADDDIGGLLDELVTAVAQLRENPELERAIECHRGALAAYEWAVADADTSSWRSRAKQSSR